jgi:hypothetical protein
LHCLGPDRLYTFYMNTPEPGVVIKVKDLKQSARRIPDPEKPDSVHGKFWFTIDITASAKDIYVPLSIASGKKPAGFMYQIEGTSDRGYCTRHHQEHGPFMQGRRSAAGNARDYRVRKDTVR